METFSEHYEKSLALLRAPAFGPNWKDVEANLKRMLAADGPDESNGIATDKIREKLQQLGKSEALPATAKANAILDACQTSVKGFQERAALLKSMQHFYLVSKKGNQNIWVQDMPKGYEQWPYDEFEGKSAEVLKADLRKDEEVFGERNRQMMSDALQLARKACFDVHIKLAASDANIVEIVKRWFHADNASENEVRATIKTLLSGFQKIAVACSSTTVVFSDLPQAREYFNEQGSIAVVDQDVERLDVLYFFEAFLTLGRSNAKNIIPKIWLCAITVIHEFSHRILGTDDIRYDHMGMKVGNEFTTKDALNNAETWGYFAADVAGIVSEVARLTALRR